MQLGQRLKEERVRIGMSQAELAAAAGIAKKSQTNYELEHSAPAADYLAAVSEVGIDVLYVLTGTPSPVLKGDEAALLRRYRAASTDVRQFVLSGLGVAAIGTSVAGPTISGGKQKQVVMGDQRNDTLTFDVGGKKGRKG